MRRDTVSTPAAPKAVGPYSQGVASGGLLFTAGQVGLDPVSGALVEGGVAAQAERALDNLEAVLVAGGSSLELLVRLELFLVEPDSFTVVNGLLSGRLGQPYPARTTVFVSSLPMGALVEVAAVGVLG